MNSPETLAQRLKLTRPLVWLDLESTVIEEGADPDPRSDRIVQLSVVKLYPEGHQRTFSALIHPGVPIAASSTQTHGICDADVEQAVPFRLLGRQIAEGLEGCDIAGYGIRRYDKPLLVAECGRHGITLWERRQPKVLDLYLLWSKWEPRDLEACYLRMTGKPRSTAGHRADADVADTIEAFCAALDVLPDLPEDLDQLADACWRPNPVHIDSEGKIQWRGDVPTMCFSQRYQGWDMRKVPGDFWHWVLDKSDCSRDLKTLAAEALNGIFPIRGQAQLSSADGTQLFGGR